MKVLIIGAGSTGLLIAQGLKKNGIPFEIFERDSPPAISKRTRDWSMLIHWGNEFFKVCLEPDHLARLKSVQCDPYYESDFGPFPDYFPLKNGKTGELLLNLPAMSAIRVSRRKLRLFLSEGLEIQYEKKVTAFSTKSDGVHVLFEDGTTATGTHLVGADGAKSIMRERLVGPEKAALTATDFVIFNFKVTYTAEQTRYMKYTPDFHPFMNFGFHGEQKAMCFVCCMEMPDKDDPSTWIWQFFKSYKGRDSEKLVAMSNEEKLKMLRDEADGWVEPWRSAGKLLNEDAIAYADVLMTWNQIAPWDNHGGRVTLAGDAGHAMTSFRGQGVNNAIQDAACYVKGMVEVRDGKITTKEAGDAYEKEMIPRGKQEIEISLESGHQIHEIDKFPFSKSPIGTIGIKAQEVAKS